MPQTGFVDGFYYCKYKRGLGNAHAGEKEGFTSYRRILILQIVGEGTKLNNFIGA
jgi:hypothetical protein